MSFSAGEYRPEGDPSSSVSDDLFFSFDDSAVACSLPFSVVSFSVNFSKGKVAVGTW